MVERREYESYIKSRVEKLLRSSEQTKETRKRAVEWILLDQIREYANSELGEEKFLDLILNDIEDITMLTNEEKFYDDNTDLIKQAIINVYKNIIKGHSTEPSKLWLDNQIAIILQSLKGISLECEKTIVEFIRSTINDFTIKYSNSQYKMDKEKNDLLSHIEYLVNSTPFRTKEELKLIIEIAISNQYRHVFTNEEIESIIESISIKYILPSELPDLSDLSKYTVPGKNFTTLYETYFNDPKTQTSIKGLLTKFSSDESITKIINKITEIKNTNDPSITSKEIRNQLINSDCGTLSREEAANILNIYMKYEANLNALDSDAFKKEMIYNAMKNHFTEFKKYIINPPSSDSHIQPTLEEKTRDIINLYYERITVDKESSYKLSTNNIKRLLYKRFLIGRKRLVERDLVSSPSILLDEDKKEQLIRETVDKVFNNIIHITTKHPLEITRYAEAGIAQVNGVFLPIDFLTELLSEQEEVLDRAMRNSCIFMNDYYNEYFDGDYNKYLLPNDDIHIFGLTRDEKGYNRMMKYLRERVESLQVHELESLVDKPTLYIASKLSTPESVDKYIANPSINSNLELERLMSINGVDGKAKSLKNRIEDYDRAQIILNSKIKPQSEDDKIKMITYFLLKKGKGRRVNISDIKNVLLENKYFFGHEYVDKFKDAIARQIRDKVLYLLKDKVSIDLIEKKYDEMFDLQKILQYKHQLTALEIIKSAKISNPNDLSGIREQFGNEMKSLKIKHNGEYTQIYKIDENNARTNIFTIKKEGNRYVIVDNGNIVATVPIHPPFENFSFDKEKYIVQMEEYGTIKIIKKEQKNIIYSFDIGEEVTAPKEETRKANLYGLVQTYISQSSRDLDEFLSDSTRIKYSGPVNIVKVYDKLIYLNHFNFILDLENIYIMDFQSYIRDFNESEENAEIGMICEITSLQEKAFVLYEQRINELLRFVSIQSASESNVISANHSVIPNLTSFSSKNYRTLIGLEEASNMDDTFFSSHSKITKKTKTLDQLIGDLTSSKYILRYATAITDEDPENIREKLLNSKEIGINELIDRTIKGTTNVLLWINNLTLEEVQKFFNIPITRSILKRVIKFGEDKQQEKLNLIKALLYQQIQKNLNDLIEFLIAYKERTTSQTEKEQIDNWIKNCSQITNCSIITSSNNKPLVNKKISCERLTELITTQNSSGLIEFIVNPNSCSEQEFNQIKKIVTLELPNYLIMILNKNLKSSTNQRIKELSAITKEIISSQSGADIYSEKLLGLQDERYPILKEINRKIKRSFVYYDDIMRSTLSSYDKIKYEIELCKNQALFYIESLKILEEKEKELQNTNLRKEVISDLATMIPRSNFIQKNQKVIKRKLAQTKQKMETLIEVRKFLDNPEEKITAEDIEKMIKCAFELNSQNKKILVEIAQKIENVKRINGSNKDIVNLCNKAITYLSCTRQTIPMLEELEGTLGNKKVRGEIITRHISRNGVYDVPTTSNAQLLSKSIAIEENSYNNYMFSKFYPLLYLLMQDTLKNLSQEEKEEYLNMILSKIQQKHMEFDEQYISYEEFILAKRLGQTEQLCNEEITNIKSEINKAIGNTTINVSDGIISIISEKIRAVSQKKQKMHSEIVSIINQTCIKQLTKEQCDEIRHKINQQFDEMIIIKQVMYSLIEKIKNSSKKNILSLTTKSAYIEQIRRTNIMMKKYYEFLKSLPYTFAITSLPNVFETQKDINAYNDMVDIEFRELVMDVSNVYNSCEVFDPTSGTYGKPSISIKG